MIVWPCGQEYWYQATNVWENDRLMRFVPNAPVMARYAVPWDQTLPPDAGESKLNQKRATPHVFPTTQHRSLRREKADAPWDYHHFATAQSVAAVANAGGSVHAGAHGQMQVMR